MADLIDPETVKAMDDLPAPWQAREDFAEGSEELMTMLKYIDSIGEEYNKKKEYMDVLDYMDTLLDRQKKIISYLKSPYATDSPETVATMAEFGMEDECPTELTLPDGRVLRESTTPHRYYWARNKLILHFTQHGSWRLICRNVKPADAIKAAIAGRRIDYNLYWDPQTNVAVAVRGRPYDPRDRRTRIQKVTTVFQRTDERALRAFQALEQLYFNNASKRRYGRMPQRPRGPPMRNPRYKKKRWDPTTYPDREILRLTLDNLPDGKGNSYVAPSEDELRYARKALVPKRSEIGNYDERVLYDRDGYIVDRQTAREDKRRLQQDMRVVENQFRNEDDYQKRKREREERERKEREERRIRQEEQKKRQEEEMRKKMEIERAEKDRLRRKQLDDTFDDLFPKKNELFPGVEPPPPPPANLFPTLVRQRSSNSSEDGKPEEKKVRVKTDMTETENT